MSFRAALLALSLSTALVAVPAFAVEPAPLSELVKSVDIPYQQFTLPNGLRVLVHTDRKAPLVHVGVWYHIGSKDEPAGKTGFAHLFEHIMFYGSEHAPGDFFNYLQDIGATDTNGTTWYDRTNYFETVPTGALDRAMFLESDRMGYLLGGLTQARLDAQRGVVQNEKRQGDNQPFGTVDYLVNDVLFPVGHPYRHQTIGSMADLNAASLATVKNWFSSHYAPNNAVLVLAGDIDLPTAKAKASKWFGSIPAGPANIHPVVPIPTLSANIDKVMHDQVPYARVQRSWVVEGVNGHDTEALDAALSILGGLSSSRLDNALVRGDKSAVGVSAGLEDHESLSIVTISANVKPGQDPAAVASHLDAIVADFIKQGPTADEVRRVATKEVAGQIAGYETVGGFSGKGPTLAQGLLYSNDPAKYKKDLAETAALTPTRVRDAAAKWLGRPAFRLTVLPGVREDTPEMRAIRGDVAPPAGRGASHFRKPGEWPATVVTQNAAPDRSSFPPVGQLAALSFPSIERATLANGIQVFLARRPETPTARVAVSFNAGTSADPRDAVGTQSLMLALMDEGTQRLNSIQIAEAQERLGATISGATTLDRTSMQLYALKPNLAPSLDLLADIVRNPAFAEGEFQRLRAQQLSAVAATLADPSNAARYVAGPIAFGPDHPYNVWGRGNGDPAALAKLTRDDVVRFHHDWIVPSNAQVFVVGDTTLAEIVPLLESRFGNWPMDRRARPVKDLTAAVPVKASRIYLVDKPGAPQSVLRGVLALPVTGKSDLVPLESANDVLGGGFINRLNNDLREEKGWSYGAGSAVTSFEGPATFLAVAPVQTDKTGESLSAMIADVKAFATTRPIEAAELARSVNGAVRALPGEFETSDAVLGALQQIVWLGRADYYYVGLPARYRALTTTQLDAASRAVIDPAHIAWIVVGDAKVIRPQLEKVGLPIETVELPKTN
ncbi:Putative zinc protease [Sphingomonas antarctica]|uniref:M16 family metallopeptidase n=1 Tax=Sphingomonas antarctica TaxID=2040274 RepID=UPI0039ECAB5D